MKIKKFNENNKELDPYGEEDWEDKGLDNFHIERAHAIIVFRVDVNFMNQDLKFDVHYNEDGGYIFHELINEQEYINHDITNH